MYYVYDSTMTQKRLTQIETRIAEIKVELAGIGEMRPGSLTAQHRDKQKQSGPYYQLSYTHEMKNQTNYIREDCVDNIRQQIESYKCFKRLTTEWVALGIEHSKLSIQLKRERAKKSESKATKAKP